MEPAHSGPRKLPASRAGLYATADAESDAECMHAGCRVKLLEAARPAGLA
jgi:hypothetical protein